MQSSTVKKVGRRVLQIGLPVAIILFFINELRKDWGSLTAHTFHLNLWLLALASFGFILQELSFGVIWQAVLARLGHRINLRTSLRIYLASEFVRYIPGNVWHVLTRILWVSKYGVSRPVAFASMMIELISKLAAGALVFAISLLFWHDLGASAVGSLPFLNGYVLTMLGILIILAMLVLLHPRILSGLLNTALRLLKKNPVVLSVRYTDILLVTLAWCVSWCVAGCAFYVLLLSLWPGTPLIALPICIGIYALAWDVGFVSFVTPGGLGFREVAIELLLSLALPLPVGLGIVMAWLSRLVSTLAELLCVGIAYLSGGRQMRDVQQEQGTSHSLATIDTQETPDDAVPDQHPATSAVLEKGAVRE